MGWCYAGQHAPLRPVYVPRVKPLGRVLLACRDRRGSLVAPTRPSSLGASLLRFKEINQVKRQAMLAVAFELQTNSDMTYSLQKAFKRLDTGGDGTINLTELQDGRVLTALAPLLRRHLRRPLCHPAVPRTHQGLAHSVRVSFFWHAGVLPRHGYCKQLDGGACVCLGTATGLKSTGVTQEEVGEMFAAMDTTGSASGSAVGKRLPGSLLVLDMRLFRIVVPTFLPG